MCGIAGIWNLNGQELHREKLVRFTDTLKHRGPDGGGYFVDENNRLGLGHRRLSILDLSDRGSQPMSYSNERYWICYNGEVYNFIELREELEQKGCRFKTDTDTEVVVAAYHEWGKECLTRFNGMWAIAIWDSKTQKLFLSRDRWGIKPLHYLFLSNTVFAFASETLAFKHLEGFNRMIHKDQAARCLSDTSSLEGEGYTIYENIFQLLPGHYIEMGKNTLPVQKIWWNTLNHRVEVPATYQEQVEKFRTLFEDACRLRLRSDVPVASALSGGLDSSSVYCMLHRMMKKNPPRERIPGNWQTAYTAYFPGTPNDEKHFAEKVIEYTNGSGKFIEPDYKNLAADIMNTTRLFDAIAPTPILCATDVYKAMQRDSIKVSMDGHGVDEMLFGYTSMVMELYRAAIESRDHEFSADILDTYAHLFGTGEQGRAKNGLISYGNLFKPSVMKSLYKKFAPDFLKNAYRKHQKENHSPANTWLLLQPEAPLKKLGDHAVEMNSGNLADKIVYEFFHKTSMCVNLMNFDRASMQNGVEIRMPFMDWRLVTYVFSLPLKSKIGNGFTKKILRDSMKGILPESIRTRKLKTGLKAPIKEWMTGELKEFVSDQFASRKFLESDIWDGRLIQSFYQKKTGNHSLTTGDAQKLWIYLNAHIVFQN